MDISIEFERNYVGPFGSFCTCSFRLTSAGVERFHSSDDHRTTVQSTQTNSRPPGAHSFGHLSAYYTYSTFAPLLRTLRTGANRGRDRERESESDFDQNQYKPLKCTHRPQRSDDCALAVFTAGTGAGGRIFAESSAAFGW